MVLNLNLMHHGPYAIPNTPQTEGVYVACHDSAFLDLNVASVVLLSLLYVDYVILLAKTCSGMNIYMQH